MRWLWKGYSVCKKKKKKSGVSTEAHLIKEKENDHREKQIMFYILLRALRKIDHSSQEWCNLCVKEILNTLDILITQITGSYLRVT